MKILDSISAKVGDTWPAMTRVIALSVVFTAYFVAVDCLTRCTEPYLKLQGKNKNTLAFYYVILGHFGQAFLIMAIGSPSRPAYNVIQQYLERMGLVWRLQQDGLALRHSSEKWRGDRRVVLIAVQHNGEALRYASQKLQCDREIVLKAVSQNGQALRYAGAKLHNDEEVVLAAVTQTPLAFSHASPALRGNPAFSLEAVCRNRDALPETLLSFRKEFLAMSALFGQERKHNILLTMNLAQLLFEE